MSPHTSAPTNDPIRAIEVAGAAVVDTGLRRMLVVDDEATIRLALSKFLRSRGFDVETAESGVEALQRLETQRFAVMLCDLRMPGVSGLDVVPQALARDADLGIIMLTAVNDAASATEASGVGNATAGTNPTATITVTAGDKTASVTVNVK